MQRLNVEFTVGLFMLAGLAAFFYLAIRMGDIGLFERPSYRLEARFSNSSGLKEGAFVELAGVHIGKVARIRLDPGDYESVVVLEIDRDVPLQEDSIASIRTAGILGDRFVKITPGGAEDYLADGDQIIETESAISLEELVSKYIFESGGKPE